MCIIALRDFIIPQLLRLQSYQTHIHAATIEVELEYAETACNNLPLNVSFYLFTSSTETMCVVKALDNGRSENSPH